MNMDDVLEEFHKKSIVVGKNTIITSDTKKFKNETHGTRERLYPDDAQ